MSKSALKKFRKNDYSDHDEYKDNPREREQKRNAKRVERALRTKDVSSLIEDDEDETFLSNFDMFGDIKEEY